MYGETHSESKRVNKLNTLLWSCCLKELFYGIDCLIICGSVSQFNEGLKTKKIFEWKNHPQLQLSQKARTAIKYCYHSEKRKSNK